MTHAASLADWFAFLSLGISVHAAFSVFYFLLVEAEPADFDPRPAVRRVVESSHQGAVHAGHTLNRAYASVVHEARPVVDYATAATRAALLALLFPADLEVIR